MPGKSFLQRASIFLFFTRFGFVVNGRLINAANQVAEKRMDDTVSVGAAARRFV
jgi:hypothetical protein